MRVSLDGGVSWIEVIEDVILDIPMESDPDAPGGSTTIKFTAEGVIADHWTGVENDEALLDTMCLEYCDLNNFLFRSSQNG